MGFRNPFADLGQPRVDDQGEEVQGAFACQQFGCYDTVRDARYVRETQLLTWRCTDGHDSKIEGFQIDW